MQSSLFAFKGFVTLDTQAALEQRQRLDADQNSDPFLPQKTAEEVRSSTSDIILYNTNSN